MTNTFEYGKLLKLEIIRLSDEGFTRPRMSELKQQLEMRLPHDSSAYEERKPVMGLLDRLIRCSDFGSIIFDRPARLAVAIASF